MSQSSSFSSFWRHLAAFGASEAANKATRIFVVIVVSRQLDAEALGYAAAALAIGEILKSMTENGIGQRIIAADPLDVERISNRAKQLFWAVCFGLMGLQVAGSILLYASGHQMIAILVAVLALEYLFMPAGLVQAARALRSGKLKHVAVISGTQTAGENLCVVALSLIWPSPFSLIIPRILMAPVWLFGMRYLHPWTANTQITPAPLGPFVRFGGPILGIEIVKSLRLHADKLIVAVLLGPKALGAYFLAFNAGLSLVTAFSTALGVVIFPHLCKSSAPRNDINRYIILSLLAVLPFIVLQSVFAPFYVPLLLGEKWSHIAPAIGTLCWTALPLTLWTTVAAFLRVHGRPGIELKVTVTLTGALIISTVLTAPFGVAVMAQSYVAATSIVLIIASFLCLSHSQPLALKRI